MNKGEIIPESAVRFVRILPGPVEKVWALLTQTERLPEWYGEGIIEPREGGKVQLMGGHIRGVVTGWRPTACWPTPGMSSIRARVVSRLPDFLSGICAGARRQSGKAHPHPPPHSR